MIRRLALRFAFVLVFVLIIPFPLGTLPHTEAIGSLVNDAWNAILGTALDPDSSDTLAGWLQVAVAIGIAAVITAIWSAVDRKTTAHPRLEVVLEAYVRYWLALSMITYGLVKLLPIQFPPPHVATLDERVGDMSPMGLMWTFFGYSRAYQCFAGGAELLGGVLLLWRRTKTFGAFILSAVLLNVVVLNFCYDVPVKLGSLELFIAAFALLAPGLVRMVRAALGHAVAEQPPRVRGTPRWERARIIGSCSAVALIAWTQWSLLGDFAQWFAPPTPIDGAWVVERFTDGETDRPPLLTDGERWHKVQILGGLKGGGRVGVVVVTMTGQAHRYMAVLDGTTMELKGRGDDLADPPIPPPPNETWTYTVIDAQHVRIDRGTTHVILRRAPIDPLLTRGFHWVQDWAYNR